MLAALIEELSNLSKISWADFPKYFEKVLFTSAGDNGGTENWESENYPENLSCFREIDGIELVYGERSTVWTKATTLSKYINKLLREEYGLLD